MSTRGSLKRSAPDVTPNPGPAKRAEPTTTTPFSPTVDDSDSALQDIGLFASSSEDPSQLKRGFWDDVLGRDLDSGISWPPSTRFSTTGSESSLLCLGSIFATPCKVLKNCYRCSPKDFENLRLDEKHVKLELRFLDDRCQVALPGCQPVANFKKDVGSALITINNTQFATLTAYGNHAALVKALASPRNDKKAETVIEVHVNIYSDSSQVEEIGKLLSDRDLFLQDPDWKEQGVDVRNPHFLAFESLSDAEVLVNELALTRSLTNSQDVDDNWDTVLDNLAIHRSSALISEDHQLAVPLKEHQVVGLDFMLRRETGNLGDSLKYWQLTGNDGETRTYQHVVTHAERTLLGEEPPEPRGGILGDDMGLGKTFTILALVSGSLARAQNFACNNSEHLLRQQDLWASSKGTLIVVPSMLLLDNWARETQQKLKEKSLSFTIYHGQDRARHYLELLQYDIVFTTYGTITKEFKRRKARDILYRIGWFRIVLDEAHIVRSQRTRQFGAVISLQAQHHWCLTGTPISNKVDDLGALLRFCRVPLLEERAWFNDHLVKAIKRSFRAGCGAVLKSLSPLCLRRTRKDLNLPEPMYLRYNITLSEAESRQYQAVMEYCRRALDANVSGLKSTRHTMLQSILQLRIFCNLGTFHQLAKLEIEQGLDPDEALTLLQQKEEAHCSYCPAEIHTINQMEDRASGILPTCLHVLCRACYSNTFSLDQEGHFSCPVCDLRVHQRELQQWHSSADLKAGQSSKIDRLVQDLEESKGKEKSLVLSCWKKTIDLASSICSARGISYVRIDGTVPQAERIVALKQFIEDTETSALLMTMGTGALGLNITAATRIHILEPQWNPSVEQQAIGRSVRIGQEKQTTVIRYTVENTVEEQVQLYQKNKMRLAAAGFGDNSEASVEAHTRLLTATFFRKR